VVTKLKYTEIIEKTYELVETIKTSKPYLSYIEYESKVLNDNEFKEIFIEFQKNKELFEEAYPYKSYYPNFDEVKSNYQQSKIKLMKNELYQQCAHVNS